MDYYYIHYDVLILLLGGGRTEPLGTYLSVKKCHNFCGENSNTSI